MKISPSLMCMDLLKFKEQIEFIDQNADYFHIDIMDGHFVPNLTLSPFFVSQVKRIANKPLDCHLMVTRPQDYIAPLAKAGADFIAAPRNSQRASISLDRGIPQFRDESRPDPQSRNVGR